MIFTLITLLHLAAVKAEAVEQSTIEGVQAQANPEARIPLVPRVEAGQDEVYYYGSALAALNGQPPPYDTRFPLVDQGYLVPILVDDNADLSAYSHYQWVDPGAHATEILDAPQDRVEE